jgi:multidrug resistance efflux pump
MVKKRMVFLCVGVVIFGLAFFGWKLMPRLYRVFRKVHLPEAPLSYVLVVTFVLAAFAESLGLAAITGAFLAGLAVREKRVSVLESDIATYLAELAVAEANLEGTIIRAPDEGAVVRRIVEPGGSAVVGQPIISLWVGEEIWVEAWVDEDDLAYLEIGGTATVSFKSYPDREFTGVVETLAVSTDSELPDSEVQKPRHERMRDAPVISVRIRLDDPEEDLFPGLSAIVGIRKKGR